jgi:HEAT repeat protein
VTRVASGFVAALVAITALLVLLALATAVRKAMRESRDRRHARVEAAVRPALLSYLAEDEPDPHELDEVVQGRAAGRSLQELAAGLLTKLRGEDRRVLERLLDAQGVLDQARRRTRRPGPVGRARAADLLGAAGYEAALPELTRLLRDRDPDVRAAAARALGKLAVPSAVPALLGSLDARRAVPAGVVTMAILHIGPEAAAPLADGLSLDHSGTARAISAELLGRLGGFQAAGRLIEALGSDPEERVRAAAARALGRIGVPRSVPPLEAALMQDASASVKQAAAWALGELGGTRGFAGLTAALRSPDHALARRAADALVSCGPLGVALLQRTAATDEPGSPEARETLGRLEPAAA